MTEILIALLPALVTAAASVVTVIITSRNAGKEMDAKLDKQQAVTETKLEELTREVRLHNGFAQRVPVLEEQIKVVNHRINDLEVLRNN